MCGRLNFSLYGTRDAASNWEECYTDVMISLGFTPGKTSPFVFSFSNQWEDAFLSNGGHRVNFSSRMLNPLEVIQNIDFDLPFTFINIEGNGKPKTINLKGCKSLVEIKKKKLKVMILKNGARQFLPQMKELLIIFKEELFMVQLRL